MSEHDTKVVTRFAPSPTGFPHLGTGMYAVLNYIYAHQNNGKVLMRSEDTDPVRSKPEYEKAIIEGLAWLGIQADSFYRQTDRLDIYKKYIAKMIADGTAYVSPDTNEKGETRDVVRFKNPNKVITFRDSSRGDISVNTTDLGDFIIARDVNSPLYHLTVVIDDHETGVSHIIRGEDGLANTPRQILIQEAIGAQRPVYAHYPFILLPNRTKMGKRNGAKSLQEYKELGYLPEAVLNFIILMAWHPQDDREIFTMSDLLKEFQLERIGKGGAILDEKKLRWINKEHLKRLPKEELDKIISEKVSATFPGQIIPKGIIDIVAERIEVFSDIDTLIEAGELDYYFTSPELDAAKIPWKTASKEETITHLKKVKEIITNSGDLMKYAEEVGKGNVLWPVRYALSGKEKSPDPFTLLTILGPEESLTRVQAAIETLTHA